MEPQIIPIARKTAIYSAAIGTCLLLAFLACKQASLVYIGFSYILLAFTFNIIILLALIIALFSHTMHWKKIVATIICLLTNIPLSILYFSIVIH